MRPRGPKLYSAQQVHELAGLSRPMVYHLMEVGLLRPATPKGARARFDEDSLQIARMFAAIQRKGVGPKALVRLIDRAAVDALYRFRGTLMSIDREKANLAREILVVLDDLRAARERMPERQWKARALEAVDGLLNKAEGHRLLEEVHEAGTAGRFGLTSDDQAWSQLDSLFENPAERNRFLSLLERTGVLAQITRVRQEDYRLADVPEATGAAEKRGSSDPRQHGSARPRSEQR